MPKNAVTDPITDQEINFAHLILSGTMNDRQAAEAAGLNPTTAAYTKSKPRVREYMDQHRAAVSEKLADQEAEGLRRFHLGRDQILTRLWELARLSPEATRNSIAGQVKAMAMIATIEGYLPGRRLSNASGQSVSPAVRSKIDVSEEMPQRPVANMEPASAPPGPETPPEPSNDAPSLNQARSYTSQDNPFTDPKRVSSALDAMPLNFDAHIQTMSSLKLPIAVGRASFAHGR
jgi:hypothetical protein